MKLLIIQSAPASYHFVYLWYK